MSDDIVSVQKWDCGDIAHLAIDALRPLPPSYRNKPQMVFPARLDGNLTLFAVFCVDIFEWTHFVSLIFR